jgi:hypothetical protein
MITLASASPRVIGEFMNALGGTGRTLAKTPRKTIYQTGRTTRIVTKTEEQ